MSRIRSAIYETLRRVKPRPDEDISVKWAGVPLSGKRKFGGLPMWIYASVAAVLLVGAFAALSTLINRDGSAVSARLTSLHPSLASLTLVRDFPVEIFQPPPPDETQLERVRDALAGQDVEVGMRGDYIFIRVGNALLFDPGSAEVKPRFQAVAEDIIRMLNDEQGPVLVLGYTDSDQPGARARFKTNQELSVARAQAVADILDAGMTVPDCAPETFALSFGEGEPSSNVPVTNTNPACQDSFQRLTVEGRGEAEPIADNSTPEGRALNRRVEILLAREGTF